jgi:hypothetical protein
VSAGHCKPQSATHFEVVHERDSLVRKKGKGDTRE